MMCVDELMNTKPDMLAGGSGCFEADDNLQHTIIQYLQGIVANQCRSTEERSRHYRWSERVIRGRSFEAVR